MSEVIGKIKLIKDVQVVSEKFQKREFVIETDEQYPQTLSFELQGQNCDIIDAYKVNQEVKVHINFRGRMWTSPQGEDKYFNTLVCWRLEPSNAPVGGYDPPKNKPTEVKNVAQEEEDDLPF